MNVSDIEGNLKEITTLLKALSNEKRLCILCALHTGEKKVGELEAIVGLSQSALSQHLARLRKDKLVMARREAQTIYYSTNSPAVHAIMHCLCGLYGLARG